MGTKQPNEVLAEARREVLDVKETACCVVGGDRAG
jgi:hypothetical protein